MEEAGVRLAVALPIGFPLSRPLKGRIDMRNHRKIVVDRQPRHLLRLEQLRRRRLRDQAALRALGRRDDALRGPDRAAEPARLRHRLDGARQGGPERRCSPSRSRRSSDGFPAQVIATGATVRYSAMPEMFEVADVRRPARARRDHPLLRPRRADPGRALRQRPPRRRHHRRLPGEERQLDRRRRQPQLLRRAARRRRADLRVRRRPAAHQVDDRRRRGDADRLGEHRPPQLRAQLREQHPARRPRPHRRDARAPDRATSPPRPRSTPPTSSPGAVAG